MSPVIETKKRFIFGEVQGNIALSDSVFRAAADVARQHFDEQQAIEFSDNPVDTFLAPAWMPARDSWFPADALRELGFIAASNPASGEPEHLVVTYGTDLHIDAHGPVLCLVLHNDGLKFKQGKAAHIPQAGDWFVFDDLQPHGVKEAKGRAVWASYNVPLAREAR